MPRKLFFEHTHEYMHSRKPIRELSHTFVQYRQFHENLQFLTTEMNEPVLITDDKNNWLIYKYARQSIASSTVMTSSSLDVLIFS